MTTRKPSHRRKPEKTPLPPRDRLAEIRAEIQDVQHQIDTKRRQGRVIRSAEDFKSMERDIAALTSRFSALLKAEATQAALDDGEPPPGPLLLSRSGLHGQGSRTTRRHAPDHMRPVHHPGISDAGQGGFRGR
jgi:hypothetical protein